MLRRVDGSSVYTVAGSELYTSARILAAEQRLVRTAGRTDRRVLDGDTVELALLESAANGDSLDAAQTALVRAMCTSGARLQLAIAPGWCREDHRHAHPGSGVEQQRRPGNRFAPSAATAAQLRDATGAPGRDAGEMINRGRAANHLYVSVVGDGNPHAVIQPDSLRLRTATELLEQILGRDASPRSATTLHRSNTTPLRGSARPPHGTSTPSTSPPNTSPTHRSLQASTRVPTICSMGSQVSRRGRPCVATCCCWPPPALIRSRNCSPPQHNVT